MANEEYLREWADDKRGHQTRSNKDLVFENEMLRSTAVSLEVEVFRLRDQVGSLQHKLADDQSEHERVRQQLRDTQAANMRLMRRYEETEAETWTLSNLYVASDRLNRTIDRREVLNAIQEIIIDLIGSEELCVFELNKRSSALSLVSCFGLDPEPIQSIPLNSGLIGWVASTGKTYVEGASRVTRLPHEHHLTACIPLKLSGEVFGTIAVFRLLEQKRGLDELDRQLLGLLATHAATALYCTGLRGAR
jgi:GAF domain-containing protein